LKQKHQIAIGKGRNLGECQQAKNQNNTTAKKRRYHNGHGHINKHTDTHTEKREAKKYGFKADGFYDHGHCVHCVHYEDYVC